MNVEQVGKQVLDAAFHVHTVLGPGLLESVYEAALTLELRKRGLRVEVQKAIPVFYDGQQLDVGFRADLIVEGLVLVARERVPRRNEGGEGGMKFSFSDLRSLRPFAGHFEPCR